MKQKLIYFLLLSTIGYNAIGQQPVKNNAVYLELGGNGLFYSLNYDKLINLSTRVKLAPRIGFSYLPYDGGNDFKNLIIPTELNFLYGKTAQSKNFAEAGVGLTFLEFINGFRNGDKNDPVSKFANVTLVRLGYRHQKPTGGLMYRAGLLVPITQDEFSKQKVGDDIFFRLWAGFSLGYSF